MLLTDYAVSTRKRVLIYGPPKSGKTALVGKLAQHYKMHWIDLESGIKTLMNPAILKPEFRSNVSVINVPDHAGLPIGFQTVVQILKGSPVKVCYLHGKVNCPICNKDAAAVHTGICLKEFTDNDILVVDTLGQVAASAMNHVTHKERIKPGGEEYRPTIHDFAAQGVMMEQLLSLMQASNINLVCITHDTEAETVDGKERVVPVAGTRNFSRNVAKYFDTVVHTTIINKKHSALSTSTSSPTHLTGDRFGVTLDTLKDADLSLMPIFQAK
jgi:hypothetical protein